jgi:hypothetical protein
MYVSANEKVVSLNLHRYGEGGQTQDADANRPR